MYQMLVTGGVAVAPPGRPSLSAVNTVTHRKHPRAGRAGPAAPGGWTSHVPYARTVPTVGTVRTQNDGRLTQLWNTKPQNRPLLKCAMMGTRGPY